MKAKQELMDYEYEARKAAWMLDEAICILFDISPWPRNMERIESIFKKNQHIAMAFNLAVRCIKATEALKAQKKKRVANLQYLECFYDDDGYWMVRPIDFLNWAQSQGYKPPKQLLEVITKCHAIKIAKKRRKDLQEQDELIKKSQILAEDWFLAHEENLKRLSGDKKPLAKAEVERRLKKRYEAYQQFTGKDTIAGWINDQYQDHCKRVKIITGKQFAGDV